LPGHVSKFFLQLQDDCATLAKDIIYVHVRHLMPDGRLHDVAQAFADGGERQGAIRKIEIRACLFWVIDLPHCEASDFHTLVFGGDLVRSKAEALGRGRDEVVSVYQR
jgi:hypothetical protein